MLHFYNSGFLCSFLADIFCFPHFGLLHLIYLCRSILAKQRWGEGRLSGNSVKDRWLDVGVSGTWLIPWAFHLCLKNTTYRTVQMLPLASAWPTNMKKDRLPCPRWRPSSAMQLESAVYFQRATNFSLDKVKAAPTASPHQPPQQRADKLLSVKSQPWQLLCEILILEKQLYSAPFISECETVSAGIHAPP